MIHQFFTSVLIKSKHYCFWNHRGCSSI